MRRTKYWVLRSLTYTIIYYRASSVSGRDVAREQPPGNRKKPNSCPCGQDIAVFPVRHHPLCPAIEISPKATSAINLLLTKLCRVRWLDIGLVLYVRIYGPRPWTSPWFIQRAQLNFTLDVWPLPTPPHCFLPGRLSLSTWDFACYKHSNLRHVLTACLQWSRDPADRQCAMRCPHPCLLHPAVLWHSVALDMPSPGSTLTPTSTASSGCYPCYMRQRRVSVEWSKFSWMLDKGFPLSVSERLLSTSIWKN